MRDGVPGSRGHRAKVGFVALVAWATAMAVTLPATAASAQDQPLDPYASTVLAAGPTSYWRLGDAGPVAADELGRNPGSVTGGVVPGEPGALPESTNTAMRLDGASGYVALGSDTSLRPALFTVEAWFRSFGQVTEGGYLGRWRPFGWEALIDTHGRVFGSVYGQSGGQYITRSTGAFDDGLWHHYALTRDSTSLRLYVDGVERSNVAMTEPTRYGTGGAAIGRQGNFDCCYFNGLIDEFALYDHPLTDAAVADHYCIGGGTASFCNRPPTADAGADQPVVEGSTVTLDGSGSSDPDGDVLDHSWELVDATGPSVTLSSTTAAQPTFAAPDDGVYHFALTVSDDQETSSDDVVVTVENAPPAADVVVSPTSEPRTIDAVTTISDPGVLDTHTAVYDWGDGSPVETLVSGAGGGSVDAVHTFAHPGTFTVTVLVTDDDGGSTADTAVVEITDPVPFAGPSLWANAVGAGVALQLMGTDLEVDGLAHSNAGLSVGGQGVRLLGGTEYVSALVKKGPHHVLAAPVARVTPSAPPVDHSIEQYRPGGPVARSAGTYLDVTSKCRNGVWQPSQPLTSGLYYARCAVRLTGRVLGAAPVTIAAEGEIDVRTPGAAAFRPFADDALLVSGSSSEHAIAFVGVNARVGGWLAATRGTILVRGTGLEFECGLVANRIGVSGARLRFDRSSCH